MKYFIDTEFIEYPNTIELISIGIVNENNEKLYLISNEYNESNADDWVKDNVLIYVNKNEGISIAEIREKIVNFFGNDDDIKIYMYYGAYDWVVFCWIFGKMIDLPKNFPMFFYDLKVMMIEYENFYNTFPENNNEHNALSDAMWNKEIYEYIMKIEEGKYYE